MYAYDLVVVAADLCGHPPKEEVPHAYATHPPHHLSPPPPEGPAPGQRHEPRLWRGLLVGPAGEDQPDRLHRRPGQRHPLSHAGGPAEQGPRRCLPPRPPAGADPLRGPSLAVRAASAALGHALRLYLNAQFYLRDPVRRDARLRGPRPPLPHPHLRRPPGGKGLHAPHLL